MSGMKILQLVKWLSPYMDTGGKIRSYKLGELLSTFADVDVIGFSNHRERIRDSEPDLKHYRNCYSIPFDGSFGQAIRCLSNLRRGLSLRSARFYSERYRRTLTDLLTLNRYDALQVEELPMMSMIHALSDSPPVVYSAYNAESELSPALLSRRGRLPSFVVKWEARQTRLEEKRAVERSAACLVVSEKDGSVLRSHLGQRRTPIYVLDNCAPERFRASSPRLADKEIVTVGCFGWHPNVQGLLWFLDEVLPDLKKRRPDCRVRIVGSKIGKDLKRRLLQKGCMVNNDVPDVLPFLQQARVMMVPLTVGGGTRIKIVEAWAAGLPVVSTATGADGLNATPGKDLLIADRPASFGEALCQVLDDDDVYHRLRDEGMQRASKLRWMNYREPLKAVYDTHVKNG